MTPSINIYTNSNSYRQFGINSNRNKNNEKLQKTAIGSHRILFKARSVFPFDFFPDEVVIDENKVDLVYGIFFYTRQVISVSINDLNGAMSVSNMLFGSLELEIRGYDRNPLPITYLWNHDAERARRIINGLVACVKQGVDTSTLNLKFAQDKIENIGSTRQTY